jgi:hypothetical protein
MKRILFWALLAHSAAILAVRWNQPLVGEHGFRQTQTALSVFWLLRGGPWLAYWTPVLGPPWSIPFEFPLFQWIVALLARMGVGLDPSGRCVAWAFGVLALFPLRRIATHFDIDPWIVGCLYLASPLYLYWSTAFLIDTCALFFAASFLAYGLEDKWIFCLLSGVLTALVKLPTLLPFAAVLLFLLWWPRSPWAFAGLPTRIELRRVRRLEHF